MKVKLTRISSIHNNMRTDSVVGDAKTLPRINEPFVVFAYPLDKNADVRVVHTTKVLEIKRISDFELEFKTANSTYQLAILAEAA